MECFDDLNGEGEIMMTDEWRDRLAAALLRKAKKQNVSKQYPQKPFAIEQGARKDLGKMHCRRDEIVYGTKGVEIVGRLSASLNSRYDRYTDVHSPPLWPSTPIVGIDENL